MTKLSPTFPRGRRFVRVLVLAAVVLPPVSLLRAQVLTGSLWSTYVGGTANDWVSRVAVDGDDHILFTGGTASSGWLGGGPDLVYSGNGDGYVAQLTMDGAAVWGTYLGYTGGDQAADVAADADGNVLIAGSTSSHEWVGGSMMSENAGHVDGFLVKLAADGHHLWSTFLGGGANDWATALAIDDTGVIYVAGMTASDEWDLPEHGADGDPVLPLAPYAGGDSDAFLMAFNAQGVLLWFRYVGGNSTDAIQALAPMPGGGVVAAGATRSAGWAVNGADPTYSGGDDGFVARFGADGTLLWMSYVGGTGDDGATCVATDADGKIFLGGDTWSPEWIAASVETPYRGNGDGWCVTFDADGVPLWARYLGGIFRDAVLGIAVDGEGNIVAVGLTESGGWISGGFDRDYGGNQDGFAVKMEPDGQTIWSTYLGRFSVDSAEGVAITPTGEVIVVGRTDSAGWISGGGDTSHNGAADGFIIVITDVAEGLGYTVAVGPDDVALGHGFWDLSGHYETDLDGLPLRFDMVQAGSGKIVGDGVLTLTTNDGKEAFDLPVLVKGKVKGKTSRTGSSLIASLAIRGKIKGIPGDPLLKAAVAAKLQMQLVPDELVLRGTGKVKTKIGKVSTASQPEISLGVPAGMNGTYELIIEANTLGDALAGTAVLRLSNEREFPLIVGGTRGEESDALVFAGDKTDPSAKGIKIKATLREEGDGTASVERFAGKALGQAQKW